MRPPRHASSLGPLQASALVALAIGATVSSARPAVSQAAGATVVSVGYRIIRNVASADTLNARVVNANAVVYDAAASTHFGAGGAYRLRWHGDAFGLLRGAFFRLSPGTDVEAELRASLASRPVAATALTDGSVRALPNFPAEAATRPLIAATVPFEVIGPGGGPNGQRADVVMLQRHVPGDAADSLARNSRLFGTRGDTLRVQIPPNAWMPGDTLYVIEHLAAGRTITLRMTLACAPGGVPRRTTCNPIALGTLGATGYLPLSAGFESVWRVGSRAAR